MARRKTKKQHRQQSKRRPKVSAKAARRKSPSTLLPAKILIVPDTHVPYEDVDAFNLMLKAAATLNNGRGPDAVVLLGDFFDCYELSTHEKSPQRRMGLAEEVEATQVRLNQLAVLVEGKKPHPALRWSSTDKNFLASQSDGREFFRQLYYILGNHENRVERALGQDPKTRGILSTYMSAGMLHKRTLGDLFPEWSIVDYMHTLFLSTSYTRAPALALTHDVGKAGQTAHVDAGRVMGACHTAIGHTHRLAHATHTVGGVTYSDHMFGWLGDTAQQGYMPAMRMARDWAHGFGVVTVQSEMTIPMTGVGRERWQLLVEPLVHVQGIAIQHSGPDSDDELSCVVDGVCVRSKHGVTPRLVAA